MPELYLSYIIIIILIIVVVYQFIKYNDDKNNRDDKYDKYDKDDKKNNKDTIYIQPVPSGPNVADVVNVYNKMRNYDYKSYDDPLTPPEKRDDADLPPQVLHPDLYNVYTSGGPGIYKKFGYVKTDAEDVSSKYKFMNLIGRQKYEGSNQYQYYLVSTDRNDNIKIDLPQIRRELNTGDQIDVPQLTTDKYDVHIDKNIDYVYSPVIF